MNMAVGSLEECRYYLILTRDLDYAETKGLDGQLDEVSKLLSSYTKAISASVS
jgi:four helix bundle protein